MARRPDLIYRGSPKHKNRPVHSRKGTRCPEWTQEAGSVRPRVDMTRHSWERTIAADLLRSSVPDPEGSEKRFSTKRGIAFVGHDTGDGTWHGYPVPWNDVPAALKERWRDAGQVTRRDLKRYGEFERSDLDWALRSDDA